MFAVEVYSWAEGGRRSRSGTSFQQPPSSWSSVNKVRSSQGELGLNSNHNNKVNRVIPACRNVTVPLRWHGSPCSASQQPAIDHTLIRNGRGLLLSAVWAMPVWDTQIWTEWNNRLKILLLNTHTHTECVHADVRWLQYLGLHTLCEDDTSGEWPGWQQREEKRLKENTLLIRGGKFIFFAPTPNWIFKIDKI